MHPQALHFTLFVKNLLPAFFKAVKVLDVGSGDINGNNRGLFSELISYDGNDVAPGKNVTIVSPTSKLPFSDATFDTIISTECFEHDPEWELSIKKIYSMLRPGGLFCFTCASTGRREHGTRRSLSHDSFGTKNNVEGWTDYYRNLTIQDINSILPIKDSFSQFAAYYNAESKDLYFWGIKTTEEPIVYSTTEYSARGCVKTA